MTNALDQLPFDVLFHIAASLDYDDIIHLGYTCRQLKALLHESTLCRKAIETHAPHSKEAQLAQHQQITYSEALRSIYDRRAAFSNANPFSARVLGQGAAFTYRQGVLCVLDGNKIRVSDVHASSDTFEIDLATIFLHSLGDSASVSASEPKISLLYYCDDIVAVHYERKGRPAYGRIFAISTKRHVANGKRVINTFSLESSYKLFVRHTSEFLYYGTYTGMGNHGHHEWEIRGGPLDPQSSTQFCLQLAEFFGTDIGSTIAFHIHNGHFHAVSNQTSFDVEELDWTSFYHCIRFPLTLPAGGVVEANQRVYRRQHAEGPIHDSWTDLTIQIDESTDQPMIVESRREWQNGSSRQLRTFYISEFQSTVKDEDDAATPTESGRGPLPPIGDAFRGLLNSSSIYNYAPVKPRFTWEFHPEFPPNSSNIRSFILARTKFRTYNLPCSSFLDLVEDDKCCNNQATGPCLRIRIGSRRLAPMHWCAASTSPVLASSSSLNKNKSTPSPFVVEDDVLYRHSKIKMWPPPASKCACSKRLHRILNPELEGNSGNRVVTGVVDERSLIYMVRAAKGYAGTEDSANGVIVLVNFSRDLKVQSPAQGTLTTRDKDVIETEENLEKSWRWSSACQRGQCH